MGQASKAARIAVLRADELWREDRSDDFSRAELVRIELARAIAWALVAIAEALEAGGRA